MTDIEETNTSSPSTKWHYIKAKMAEHPQGTSQRPQGSAQASRRRRRDTFRRAQLVITYRGGPECSYLVCFEGRCWRYPGHWCLHDVLSHMAQRVM